jgi:cytochrome c oxidase assembly protein Cox11
MNQRQHQRGASMLAMILIAIMVGFFAMCAIRMLPIYFEYLSVKEIIEKVAADYNVKEDSIADIRRRIENLFNTNQIYALKPREVEVFREEGQTRIDASYEVRVPLFWRIDAMLKFDDLEYVAGESGRSMP